MHVDLFVKPFPSSTGLSIAHHYWCNRLDYTADALHVFFTILPLFYFSSVSLIIFFY